MEQAGQQIFDFFSNYGYAIMLPLMIIEGPVATVIAGLMASLGAFNIFIVFVLSLIGDIIGDVIFYGLGYKFGRKFVEKVGKYIGITEELVDKLEKYFASHGGKTVFVAKSTTGLCWAAFVTAGIVKMNFKKFIVYSFLGGIVWSGLLATMGYFYGYLWREIQIYIKWIGWAIVGMTILTFVLISIYKNYQAKRILGKSKK